MSASAPSSKPSSAVAKPSSQPSKVAEAEKKKKAPAAPKKPATKKTDSAPAHPTWREIITVSIPLRPFAVANNH